MFETRIGSPFDAPAGALIHLMNARGATRSEVDGEFLEHYHDETLAAYRWWAKEGYGGSGVHLTELKSSSQPHWIVHFPWDVSAQDRFDLVAARLQATVEAVRKTQVQVVAVHLIGDVYCGLEAETFHGMLRAAFRALPNVQLLACSGAENPPLSEPASESHTGFGHALVDRRTEVGGPEEGGETPHAATV